MNEWTILSIGHFNHKFRTTITFEESSFHYKFIIKLLGDDNKHGSLDIQRHQLSF